MLRLTRLLLLVLLWGCAVNPRADFQQTSNLIRERTASPEVYDPETEVDGKVHAILAERLTVDRAVRIALLNSPDLQALFQQIGASRADVVQAGLLSNPVVSFSLLFPDGGGRSKFIIGFWEEIVDLWQIPIRTKIAEDQLQQVVLQVAHRGVDVAAETRVACYRLLAAQRLESFASDYVEFFQRVEADAEREFALAHVKQEVVNRALTSLLDSQMTRIALHRHTEETRAALGRLLGTGMESWTLQDELRLDPVEHDVAVLVVDAMSERLDARGMAMQIKAAEAQIERQYLSIVNRMSVGATLERKETKGVPPRSVYNDIGKASVGKGSLTFPSIQSRGQRQIAERRIVDYLLGPRMDIQVPLWDQNQAQIAKAKYVAEQRRHEYQSLLNRIIEDVQVALAQLDAAEKQVRLYRERVLPFAASNLGKAQTEQAIVPMIDAERFLIQQQQAEVQAVRDYAVARAMLERAVGGRLKPPREGKS